MADSTKTSHPRHPAGRIEAFCPYEDCRVKFVLDASMAGQKARCGKCSRRFLVSPGPGQPCQKLEGEEPAKPKGSGIAVRPQEKKVEDAPGSGAPAPGEPPRKTVLLKSWEELQLGEVKETARPVQDFLTDDVAPPPPEEKAPEDEMSVDLKHVPKENPVESVYKDDQEQTKKEAAKMSLLEPEPPPPPPPTRVPVEPPKNENWLVVVAIVVGVLTAILVALLIFPGWDRLFGSGKSTPKAPVKALAE
ncbi:MAG: hypothetical protein HYU36_16230 [Planctomycetes bacterium]|nr:hypothetical protein [Planctomycetota bacterium]